MSENTNIEWAKHTFNPWWGCTKVHQGCKNCYAEAWDARYGGDHWGPKAWRRMILGEWSKPLKWDAQAREKGEVHRVFCASMCDIFEDFDGPVVDQRGHPVPMLDQVGNWTIPLLRKRALNLVRQTPNLLWLLLTKRPENAERMCEEVWGHSIGWPTNVMFGTSPCDQETADKSVPTLLTIPGRHFLSCEPLLGAVDLSRVNFGVPGIQNVLDCRVSELAKRAGIDKLNGIDWVIVGGESGPRARPCHVEWIRSIVRQCRAAGVPCFVKQLGARVECRNDHVSEWMDQPGGPCLDDISTEGVVMQGDPVRVLMADRKGGDPHEWPEDLRVRGVP